VSGGDSIRPGSPPDGDSRSAFLEGGLDLDLAVFNPNRQFTVTGAPSGYPGTFGLAPGTVKSDSKYFLVPDLGVTGINLTQMSLAPTYAHKVGGKHALGVSAILTMPAPAGGSGRATRMASSRSRSRPCS